MSDARPGDGPLVRLVATAGHVDHGKSTLVAALTGTDPDRLPEERRRGLTIDLGFAHGELDAGVVLSFVDVPGHVRFLRNMLAGVGAVEGCLLVVDAHEGWKPQSEEHLRILDLLGLRDGVVAITKADGVDAAGLARREVEVRDRLAGSFLAEAPIVVVDAVSGRGLDELRGALADLARRLPAAVDRDCPRLWIDRAFSVRGVGTVVTGTLTGGALHHHDELVLLPAGTTVRVRGLEVHHRAVETAAPGGRVAVNLVGVGTDALHRGDALTRAGDWHRTRCVDASLTVLPTVDRPVTARGSPLLHVGAGEHAVVLRVIGAGRIEPGTTGAVRLDLPVSLPLVQGDRFVVRDSGRGETVGGGEILDVDPRLPRSRARPDRSVDRIVAEHGWIEADRLRRLTGVRRSPDVGRWVVEPRARRRAEAALEARLAEAGALGVELATLDEREQALLADLEGVRHVRGRAVSTERAADAGGHPLVNRLRERVFAPDQPGEDELETAAWLARQGHLVRADGLWFSREAVDEATGLVGRLLADAPAGVSVSAVREAMGTSRRYALALLGLLDAAGVTRREGANRVAGPRAPWSGAGRRPGLNPR